MDLFLIDKIHSEHYSEVNKKVKIEIRKGIENPSLHPPSLALRRILGANGFLFPVILSSPKGVSKDQRSNFSRGSIRGTLCRTHGLKNHQSDRNEKYPFVPSSHEVRVARDLYTSLNEAVNGPRFGKVHIMINQ